jgi:hypothetical protein
VLDILQQSVVIKSPNVDLNIKKVQNLLCLIENTPEL